MPWAANANATSEKFETMGLSTSNIGVSIATPSNPWHWSLSTKYIQIETTLNKYIIRSFGGPVFNDAIPSEWKDFWYMNVISIGY